VEIKLKNPVLEKRYRDGHGLFKLYRVDRNRNYIVTLTDYVSEEPWYGPCSYNKANTEFNRLIYNLVRFNFMPRLPIPSHVMRQRNKIWRKNEKIRKQYERTKS